MSRSKRNKKQKNRIRTVFIVICALIIVLSGTIGGGYYYFFVTPVDSSNSDMVTFNFENKETMRNIGAELAEAGIIKNGKAFQLKAQQEGMDYLPKAGKYAFSRAMTLDDIVQILKNKETAYDYKMVIGDGTNLDQILTDFSTSEFEKLKMEAEINDVAYIKELQQKYSFLPDEILNDGFRYRLEGYLGNGEYYIKEETTLKEYIEMALDAFQKNYIDHKWEAKLAKDDRTLFEVVTMASIVRGEVMSGDTENQQKVAGVFYNRLADGMTLGSDVTVGYALGEGALNYTADELEYDSPYNTYVYPGLTLGPINNPGADVIDAVINYTKNDYYYFLADVCDDNHGEFGAIYYSTTIAEHNKYSEEYLACYRTSFE